MSGSGGEAAVASEQRRIERLGQRNVSRIISA